MPGALLPQPAPPRKACRGKRGHGQGGWLPKVIDSEPPVDKPPNVVVPPPKADQDCHNAKRRARKAETDCTLRPLNLALVKAALGAPSEPMLSGFESLNCTLARYVACHEDKHCKQHYAIKDLLVQDFCVVNWLGL
jgi:hypothetical protein